MATTPEVVVYGGTMSGIAAALNAASLGRSVVLIEPSDRLGGIVTSGLSFSDFRSLESLGGAYREYARRVEQYYRDRYGPESPQVRECYFGTIAEPKVSLLVLERMLAEQSLVRVLRGHSLSGVILGAPREGLAVIHAVRVGAPQLAPVEISAPFFIDASYEGDLAAAAGAPYRVGRESTREYGERMAGVLYMHNGKILPGSTGEADHRVQCANFRITMTRDPVNRVEIAKPSNYDRSEYAHVLEHYRSGRLKKAFTDGFDGVLRARILPNNKADVNDIKGSPLRLSLPGEMDAWPDGSPSTRWKIAARHRDYALGLLYFLQTDPELPEAVRADARQWGLPRDEFEDSSHFPPLLYVREARRILGEYVFTEQDAIAAPGSIRAKVQPDAIAMGDYVLNCHGEQKPGAFHPGVTEGDFVHDTAPFGIPYGVLVPRRIANLLVSVAVSASHVGYSALRMEPTFTAMGQAAGIAAHLALEAGGRARDVRVPQLQRILHRRGAKTVYVSDVDTDSPLFEAVQHFGTRGFFHQLADLREITWQPLKPRVDTQHTWAVPYHDLKPDQPLEAELARSWLKLAGCPSAEAAPAALRVAGLTRGQFLQILYSLGGSCK